jgi:hypothetical protein
VLEVGKLRCGRTVLHANLLQLLNCFILTRKASRLFSDLLSHRLSYIINMINPISLLQQNPRASGTCGGADRPIFISSHCKPPPSDLLAPRELCLNIISCGTWTKFISLPHRVPTYVQTESCKDPKAMANVKAPAKTGTIRSFVPRLGSLGNKKQKLKHAPPPVIESSLESGK